LRSLNLLAAFMLGQPFYYYVFLINSIYFFFIN